MQSLNLAKVNQVLCLGAHADDIEIGCGGTVLSMFGPDSGTSVRWIVFSADETRRQEAQRSARQFLSHPSSRLEIHAFRDGFFPFEGAALKECFESLKSEIEPDLILTHGGNDLHQDHRTVAELTWNTFRNHCILEYEVPKYDGGLASPNVFVPLATSAVERKIHYLAECFHSQKAKPWFDPEVFRGLMRLRGVECNSPTKYAEAFYARKITLRSG